MKRGDFIIWICALSVISFLSHIIVQTNQPSTSNPQTLLPHTSFPYRIHFSTYADDGMRDTRDRILREAKRTQWFETVQSFEPLDIPPSFATTFRRVLALPRGAGYYIWRFAILELMMDRIPFGNYFVFVDAGSVVNPRGRDKLIQWIELLRDSPYDTIGMELPFDEEVYSTEQAFQAFNVSKNSAMRQSKQLQGGILILRNGLHLRHLMQAILGVLNSDPMVITDVYNSASKALNPRFLDNRHDQTIHSLARKVYGCIKLPWPEGDTGIDKPFPALRMRQIPWKQVLQIERDVANNKTSPVVKRYAMAEYRSAKHHGYALPLMET